MPTKTSPYLSIHGVDFQIFGEYAANLSESYSNATQRMHVSALRGLFKTFIEHGLTSVDPTRLTRFAVSRSQRKVNTLELEPETLESLLRSSSVSSWHSVRNLAIIRLLVEGVKSDELRAVRTADFLDEDNSACLILRARTGRPAFPLSVETRRCLTSYLAATGMCLSSSGLLFPATRKGQVPVFRTINCPLGPIGLRDMIRRWGRLKKLDTVLSSRILRATGIRLSLRAGRSVVDIAHQYGIRADQVSTYLRDDEESTVYEGGIDGLLALLNTASSGPLQQFIEKQGIFRLSVRTGRTDE